MTEPISAEELAAIRQRANGATAGPWKAQDLFVVAGEQHIADCEWLADTDEEWKEFERNTAFVAAARQDVPALLDEVERLRTELYEAIADRDNARTRLAAFVPPGTLSAGEIPALCGTCTERLCVPGLPGCAPCVKAEVERLRAALDNERRIVREGTANMRAARAAITAERDQARTAAALAEQERDEAREQVKRVRDRHWRHEDGTDEGLCNECRTPSPCAEIRALDGTEAGQ